MIGWGVHQTDVWVILNDPSTWRAGLTKPDIVAMLEPMLQDEPGLVYNFTQPIAMRVDELTSGVKSDVAVKIFGENMDVLNSLGEAIGAVTRDLEGTANSFVERTTGQPYLNIDIDRDAVADLGLNVAEVQQIVEMGIGGQVVSEVFEGQRRFDVTVRFPENLRQDFQMLMEVPIALPGGGFCAPQAGSAHRSGGGPTGDRPGERLAAGDRRGQHRGHRHRHLRGESAGGYRPGRERSGGGLPGIRWRFRETSSGPCAI